MQAPKISQEFFVAPGIDIQKTDTEFVTLARLSPDQLRERWNSQQGRYILSTWKANRFDRKILDDLVGKFYGHTDLRGISLVKEPLSGVNLSQVDFFSANLEGSRLDYADLTDSYLSQSNLKGTCLDWAKMQGVLIDNVSFDSRTSFTGVRLQTIDFTLAEHLKDFAFGQQRIANLRAKYPKVSFVLWLTCDYGRSFPRFFAWCAGVILSFGLAYHVIPGTLTKTSFWDSLYFSLMTFLSQNSDMQAISVAGKFLASVESAIAFLMTGLLVSILVKRTIGD